MPETLHCDCRCPYFGRPHDNVYLACCECGREENVCGYCLLECRVTACLRCSQGEHSPEHDGPYTDEQVLITDTHLLDDGTVDGRTGGDDPYLAEALAKDQAVFKQALADLRARGEDRPVLLLVHGDAASARLARRMKPALADAMQLPCLQDPSIITYLTTRQVAQAALELSHVGKQAHGIFRTPAWSTGYFTVRVCGGAITVLESRTCAEASLDPPPPTGPPPDGLPLPPGRAGVRLQLLSDRLLLPAVTSTLTDRSPQQWHPQGRPVPRLPPGRSCS